MLSPGLGVGADTKNDENATGCIAIMIELDAPTLLVTSTLVQWLFATLLLMERRQEPGIDGWALSLVLHGVANMVLYARPMVPPFFGIMFYNACVMTAFSISHWAIGRIFSRYVPWWQLVLPVLVSVVLMAWHLDDIGQRVVFFSLIVGIQLIFVTGTITKSEKDGGLRLKRWLAIIVCGFGIAFLSRSLFSYFYPLLFTQFLGTSLLQAGFIMVGIAYFVVSTLAIFLFKLERLNEKLQREATRDSLTGLLNRRAFTQKAKAALAGDDYPISVLMIDIDDFKKINDSFGHSLGDKVLVHCACIFEQVIDDQGIVGRLGGEEFAVMLPHCGTAEAQLLCRQILSRISNSYTEHDMTLSTSIGVTVTKQALCIDRLLTQADDALYRAKHEGKNTFMVFEPMTRTLPIPQDDLPASH